MSKQISVSIIIPVYNPESHIKKCYDALLKQDFKELDIVIEAKAKELARFKYRDIYVYNNKKVLI